MGGGFIDMLAVSPSTDMWNAGDCPSRRDPIVQQDATMLPCWRVSSPHGMGHSGPVVRRQMRRHTLCSPGNRGLLHQEIEQLLLGERRDSPTAVSAVSGGNAQRILSGRQGRRMSCPHFQVSHKAGDATSDISACRSTSEWFPG